jgi:hypothetical protein
MKTILLPVLAIALSSISTVASAQVAWTNINNNQSIGSFFGVAGTSSEIVAVGIDGRISTRNNGTGIWTLQTFTGDPDFRDVIYANGQYVVAREGGGIMTSPDGLAWTPQSTGTTDDLRTLLWDGSRYLAAGQNGAILSSADAISWTSINSSGPFINALAYSGQRYVAAGGFGILTSTDGVSWSSPGIPPPGSSYEAATWTGSKFLIGGLGSNLYESADGLSWVLSTADFNWNIESLITEAGTTWITGDNAYIFSSNDGVSWIDQYPSPSGSEFFMDITRAGDLIVVAGFNHNVFATAIPEPSVCMLLILGITVMCFHRRKC